jgi:hypothetical protein
VLTGRVPTGRNVTPFWGSPRLLPVDGDDPERTCVAEKLDGGWKTNEPCLAINPDSADQRDLDIHQRPERVQDITSVTRRNRRAGNDSTEADPASGNSVVGVQELRLRTTGQRDLGANFAETLSKAKDDMV